MFLVILLLIALIGAGFAFLLWRAEEPGGIDDAYALIFGPPDLGGVDFENLARRTAQNDALACHPDVCGATPVDFETPVYPIPGVNLRQIVREVALEQPRTQLVYASRWGEEDRYVVRSRMMRYPDTVVARIYGAGPGRSMLGLYSRSQIGYSDMGVNRARLETWLAAIEARVAQEASNGDDGEAVR
jgi:uncharacterized protein (DUF1499 family)